MEMEVEMAGPLTAIQRCRTTCRVRLTCTTCAWNATWNRRQFGGDAIGPLRHTDGLLQHLLRPRRFFVLSQKHLRVYQKLRLPEQIEEAHEKGWPLNMRESEHFADVEYLVALLSLAIKETDDAKRNAVRTRWSPRRGSAW